jgi:hypothetical protein
MIEQIVPDKASFSNVERDYPDESDAEKWRLMQADTLLRLLKASSMEELESMADAEPIQQLIREHNEKMRGEGRS